MINQDHFLLDSGFWGFLYKILTPVEWLMTQILAGFHKLLTMIGMSPIGFSWILSIIVLVLVVHACIFPIYYKLYQDNNANPAGSCLPMLVQGPVFMCMFYTLSAIPYIARGKRASLGAFDQATAQQFSSTNMFGVVSVTDNFTTADMVGKIVIGAFVALMCGCMFYMQWFQMHRNMNPATMQGSAATMQKAMLWIFPLMYIFSGITMPFAVLVYWLTNNVCNLLRTIWQVYEFPTPGSPAADAKKIRDHDRENARREKSGEPSLEDEELRRAKEEAELKLTQGYQRQQPQRKRKKK